MNASARPERRGRLRLRPRTDLAFFFTGVGIFAILLTVWTGAITQVGMQQCPICTDNFCNGSGPCPGSVDARVSIGIVLGIEAFFVSVGLSARALANAIKSPSEGTESAFPRGPQLALHVLAPFLMFWGWAMVLLGLILPFGWGQTCAEPCGYPTFPWVLSGFPLDLVVVGGVILGAGVVSLAIVALQLRRSARARGRKPATASEVPN
jgi:hypothetical protein